MSPESIKNLYYVANNCTAVGNVVCDDCFFLTFKNGFRFRICTFFSADKLKEKKKALEAFSREDFSASESQFERIRAFLILLEAKLVIINVKEKSNRRLAEPFLRNMREGSTPIETLSCSIIEGLDLPFSVVGKIKREPIVIVSTLALACTASPSLTIFINDLVNGAFSILPAVVFSSSLVGLSILAYLFLEKGYRAWRFALAVSIGVLLATFFVWLCYVDLLIPSDPLSLPCLMGNCFLLLLAFVPALLKTVSNDRQERK